MSTACHPIYDEALFANPNVVQGRARSRGVCALFFAIAHTVCARRRRHLLPARRHLWIPVRIFDEVFVIAAQSARADRALEQLRALWHGYRIAVAVSAAEIPPGVVPPQDLEAVRRMLA